MGGRIWVKIAMLAVIVEQNTARCLLIIQQKSEDKLVATLPLVEMLDLEKVQVVDEKQLSEEVVLLHTDREYSPWDLFKPFPPENYYDYGYIDILDLTGGFTLRDGDSVQEYKCQDLLDAKTSGAITLTKSEL